MAKESSKKSIRIQDIAERLNVSTSTVSRSLNDHPMISKTTKQKVLDAAVSLGYKPAIPSLMSDSEIKTIAVVVPNATDAYYNDIIRVVQQRYHEKGFAVLVAETGYEVEKERFYFSQVEKLQVSGIIYVAHKDSDQSLEYIINRNHPMVIIHKNECQKNITKVVLDIYESLNNTVMHLKKNGAKSVVWVSNNDKNQIIQQIGSVFSEVLDIHGLASDLPIMISGNQSADSMISELESLDENTSPDAFIFCSHELAYKYQLNRCRKHKSMPLIVSVGIDQFATIAKPRISYIDLRVDEIGREAAELLDVQLSGNRNPDTRVVTSGLVIKRSSMCL